jgi:hypothetical protein
MSGLDEIDLLPKCPRCGEQPGYWTVYDDDGPVIWFYSQRHIDDGLNPPYNRFKGEGRYSRLSFLKKGRKTFVEATCMHADGAGCGEVVTVETHPEIFKRFERMYSEWFPDDIYNTEVEG